MEDNQTIIEVEPTKALTSMEDKLEKADTKSTKLSDDDSENPEGTITIIKLIIHTFTMSPLLVLPAKKMKLLHSDLKWLLLRYEIVTFRYEFLPAENDK